MKGSEALLRAITAAGGEIPATQLETWFSQLVKAGLLETETRDDKQVFYYKLTPAAVEFLKKKGVTM